jgi:glucose/arabinose dehydrogenase
LIRVSTIAIFFILLVLVSSACGGSFDRLSQKSTQSNPASLPSSELMPIVTQTFPRSTATPTSAPSATPLPNTATVAPTQPATATQTPSISSPVQFPNPEAYEWRMIADGLVQPIGITNAGDGSNRLFVLEQSGSIRVIQGNELLPEPFLNITDRVSCCGERGLLGLAFHPQYTENGLFFINYTDLDGNTVIARFQASDEVNRATSGSEIKLLTVEQPFPNHNGGGMAFGPDGYLYIGLGDGGSGGDPLGNAQNKNVFLGKILRINVDQGDLYGIPPDNPFIQDDGAPEVWFYGLRNPWRLSFDQLTGDLFIGDVGQSSWEEIDYIPAGNPGGLNFGWNYLEGTHPYASSAAPDEVMLTGPVAEYGHDQGISVIGGVVYRGEQLPAWQGIYFYGDYGSGFIWGLLPAADGSWQDRVLFHTSSSITAFGEDISGEVYYVSYQGGVYQLVERLGE